MFPVVPPCWRRRRFRTAGCSFERPARCLRSGTDSPRSSPVLAKDDLHEHSASCRFQLTGSRTGHIFLSFTPATTATGEEPMSRVRLRLVTAVGIGACLLVFSSSATAQQIGGTVRDTTGAVLPGVTVEAQSPSLIERVRSATTDANGRYLIVALEPGVYAVRYTVPGFRTVVREGITLSTGFTATVDIELAVGSVEETVTVTGASPIVDVQNVEKRATFDREIVETIPTGKSFQSYALLVPGMNAG